MIHGDHPPFTEAERQEIRRTLDEKWGTLDRSRRDARGDAERRLLLRQQTIESALRKL